MGSFGFIDDLSQPYYMPKFIADFHIHSHYSRAVSKDMNIGELDKWAKRKGIAVMGTGDFTHPEWIKELQELLQPAPEEGLFILKSAQDTDKATRFVLSVEISSIYSKGGKVRKVHTIILAPSFEVAQEINKQLGRRGNLHSDGRPILGLDVKELAKLVFAVSDKCMVIPAHAWTPWFSVFGSKSGFDSLEECFDELTPQIYAIETGLSSDPLMNWRVANLDSVALISNSDSHSGRKIGREANIFEGEMNYLAIHEAIKYGAPALADERENKSAKLLSTIEFFPEEGKYHHDGHRACKISWLPSETKAHGGKCPVCGKKVTVGVMSRVDDLATRSLNERPEGAPRFTSMVPLEEIISSALGVGVVSKAVQKEYNHLLEAFGNEFEILLEADIARIANETKLIIGEAIKRVREGKLHIEPGYDGEFGKVEIFTEEERNKFKINSI